MTTQKPTREELLKEAGMLVRMNGMYVVPREEVLHGQKVLMYQLFRRIRFSQQGSRIGKRRTPEGLLKLIKKTIGENP